MRRQITLVLAGAIAASLLGCVTTEKSIKDKGMSALPADELRAVLTSGELEHRSASGNMSTVVFKADGSANVSWGSGSDMGVWKMDGNAFCAKWNEVRGGQEKCFRVYRTSVDEYSVFGTDGALTGVFTRRK